MANGLRLVLMGTSMLMCGQALAQARVAGTPPPWYTLDGNNVDLATGEFVFFPEEISIGAGPVRLSKAIGGGGVEPDGWSGDAVDASIRFDGTYATIKVGNVSDSFIWSGTTTQAWSALGTGGRLEFAADKWTYTTRDGTRIEFSQSETYTTVQRPVLARTMRTPEVGGALGALS